MRRFLTTTAIAVALTAAYPAAFANSNAGSKLYVYDEPVQVGITQAQIAALTDENWLEVKGVGNLGETGSTTNILTYDTWDTDVAQKAKGITDAGSPELEVARIPTDPGQMALRTAANTNLNYLFRIVRNDKLTAAGKGTMIYNVGLVAGPRRPNGRNEDFDLEVFTLAFNQREIIVNAT